MHNRFDFSNKFSQTSDYRNAIIAYILTDKELARGDEIYLLGNYIKNSTDNGCFAEFKTAKKYLVRNFRNGCVSMIEVYPQEQEYVFEGFGQIWVGSYNHYLQEFTGDYLTREFEKEKYFIDSKLYNERVWPKKLEAAKNYGSTHLSKLLKRK